MISVYKLAAAINENAYSSSRNIEAFEFAGTLSEAAANMTQMIISEGNNIAEFDSYCNEIMVEAAASSPERLMAIQEGAFENFKNKVIEYFNKLIAWIKGLIVKLKASFYKLSGQTTKWYELMRSKVEEASRDSKKSSIEYEMYEWDDNYLTSTSKTVFSQLSMTAVSKFETAGNTYKDTMTKIAADTGKIYIKDTSTDFKQYKSGDSKFSTYDDDDNSNNTYVTDGSNTPRTRLQINDDAEKELDEKKESLKDELNDFKVSMYKAASAEYSRDNADSSAIIDAIAKKARSGGTTKKTIKVASKATKMLETVKNSADVISKITDEYDKQLKAVTTLRDKLDDSKVKDFDGFDKSKQSKDYQNDMRLKKYYITMSEMAKISLTHAQDCVKFAHAFMGTFKDEIIKLNKQMAQEYMGALAKYANSKSPKD